MLTSPSLVICTWLLPLIVTEPELSMVIEVLAASRVVVRLSSPVARSTSGALSSSQSTRRWPVRETHARRTTWPAAVSMSWPPSGGGAGAATPPPPHARAGRRVDELAAQRRRVDPVVKAADHVGSAHVTVTERDEHLVADLGQPGQPAPGAPPSLRDPRPPRLVVVGQPGQGDLHPEHAVRVSDIGDLSHHQAVDGRP